MTTFVEFLTTNGYPLLVVSAVILGLGSLAMILHRSPAHRQRIGEVSIAATLAFVVFSLLPIPRTGIGSWLATFEGVEHASSVAIEGDFAAKDVTTRDQSTAIQEFGGPAPFDAAPVFALPSTAASDKDLQAPNAPIVPRTVQLDLEPHSMDEAEPAETGRDLSHSAPIPNEPAGALLEQTATPDVDRLANSQGPQPAELDSLSSAPDSTAKAASAKEIAAWVFLCGSAACMAWLLLGRVQLWHLSRSAIAANDRVKTIAHECVLPRVRNRVSVLVAEKCPRPVTYGIWRPAIILPANLVRSSSSAALAHVLRHECAHINRRDAIGQLICNVALPICWLHPLYWLIRFRIRLDAELMADDWAAGQSSTVEYVEQLVQLVRRRRGVCLASAGGLGLFGSQSQFSRRMEMLMKRSTRLPTRCSSVWKGALLVIFCAAALVAADAVGGRQAAAQQNDDQARAEMRDRLAQLQEVVAQLEAQTVEAMTLAKQQADRADAAEQKLQDMTAHMQQLADRNIDAAKLAANNAQRQSDMATQRLIDLDKAAQHYAEEMQVLREVVDELKQENAVLRDELGRIKASGDRPPNPFVETAANDDPFGDSKKVAKNEAENDPFATNGVSKDLTAPQSSPFAGSGSHSASGFGNGSPDILSLATALAEGHGNLRKAEIRLAHLRRATEQGAVPESDLQIAEIELETQHNKLELYRSLAEATLDAAMSNLQSLHKQMQHTAQLAEKGYVTQSEVQLVEMKLSQAEAHVQVIKRLLSQ